MRSNYPDGVSCCLLRIFGSLLLFFAVVSSNFRDDLPWPVAFSGCLSKSSQLQGVLSERLIDPALLKGQVIGASSFHFETDLEISRSDVWFGICSFQPSHQQDVVVGQVLNDNLTQQFSLDCFLKGINGFLIKRLLVIT